MSIRYQLSSNKIDGGSKRWTHRCNRDKRGSAVIMISRRRVLLADSHTQQNGRDKARDENEALRDGDADRRRSLSLDCSDGDGIHVSHIDGNSLRFLVCRECTWVNGERIRAIRIRRLDCILRGRIRGRMRRLWLGCHGE